MHISISFRFSSVIWRFAKSCWYLFSPWYSRVCRHRNKHLCLQWQCLRLCNPYLELCLQILLNIVIDNKYQNNCNFFVDIGFKNQEAIRMMHWINWYNMLQCYSVDPTVLGELYRERNLFAILFLTALWST